MNLLSNHGISKKTLYKQGKLQLYTPTKTLVLRNAQENYLNLPNKKFRQAITKLRISAHKFPTEAGRFDYRKRTERISPLCCDAIGDEMHYLTQCQNSIIYRTRVEPLEPFHKKWKGIHKLRQIELTNAILASQSDDMLSETGLLCLNPRSFRKRSSVASFLYHTEIGSIVFVFAVLKVHSLSI